MAKKSTGLGKGLDSLIPDFYCVKIMCIHDCLPPNHVASQRCFFAARRCRTERGFSA